MYLCPFTRIWLQHQPLFSTYGSIPVNRSNPESSDLFQPQTDLFQALPNLQIPPYRSRLLAQLGQGQPQRRPAAPQLGSAEAQLSQAQAQLSRGQTQLSQGQSQLSQAQAQLNQLGQVQRQYQPNLWNSYSQPQTNGNWWNNWNSSPTYYGQLSSTGFDSWQGWLNGTICLYVLTFLICIYLIHMFVLFDTDSNMHCIMQDCVCVFIIAYLSNVNHQWALCSGPAFHFTTFIFWLQKVFTCILWYKNTLFLFMFSINCSYKFF